MKNNSQNSFRDLIFTAQRELSSTQREQEEALCQKNALEFLKEKFLKIPLAKWTIASFNAMQGEINPDPIIRNLLNQNFDVTLLMAPKVVKNMRNNSFFFFNSEGKKIDPSEAHLIFVPALAIGRQGERIGRGFGWYDQVLQKASKAFSLSLIYSYQLFSTLPQNAWDQKVQAWVSPHELRLLKVL